MHKTNAVLFIVLGLLLAGCGSEEGPDVTENSAPATWEKTIGGDEFERANAVVPAPGGGYVIAGVIGLGNATDVYLVKIDNDGEVLWERSIGGSGADETQSLIRTADGGYLVAGNTYSMGYGGSDAYMLKVDESGYKTWDGAYGVTADDMGAFASPVGGGYLLAGTIQGRDPDTGSLLLVHTSASGTLLLKDISTGDMGVMAYAGAATNDGGVIIVGTVATGITLNPSVYLLKIDQDGAMVWENSFGGSTLIDPWAITPVSDGFVIAGDVRADVFADSDTYLAKVDDSGNLMWQKSFYSDHPDEFHAVSATADGGLIVAGWTQATIIRGTDVYLVKTLADGTLQWERTFGGESFDEAYGVTTTPEGGYLVVGRTASFGTGGGDVYVIKTDSQGRVVPSP